MEPQTASTPPPCRGWVITEGAPVRLDATGFDPEADGVLVARKVRAPIDKTPDLELGDWFEIQL